MLILIFKKRVGFFLVLGAAAGLALTVVCRFHFLEVMGLFPMALHDRVIVIDPGHGGVDPGAHYRGQILEKDLVLEIAKKSAQFFANAGAKVIMTRTDDRDLAPPEIKSLAERKRRDLRARVALANQAKADLFLSIHINSSRDPGKSGLEVYYSSKQESKVLAELIEEESLRYLGKKRLPHPGSYFVLRETAMPAVLIEVGFISNPQEKKLLGERRYQERLAWVIFQGALEYFEQSLPQKVGKRRPR